MYEKTKLVFIDSGFSIKLILILAFNLFVLLIVNNYTFYS